MNIYSHFEQCIKKAAQDIVDSQISSDLINRISVEPPRDSSHGDLASNAAMVLAKPMGMAPRALAEKMVPELVRLGGVETVEVAGPGFLNIRLDRAFWHGHLAEIFSAGEAFGRGSIGAGTKVNVEYVSANPTGPMHVGHCRGAVVGDSLANLLAFAGYDVTKEYYVNDAGVQIDVLARSLWFRCQELLGTVSGPVPEGLYPADYLVPPAKLLVAEHGVALLEMGEETRLALMKEKAISSMMALIRDDLAALNIYHDVFFSERSLHDPSEGKSRIDTMLEVMRNEGFVYEGRLPPPKGEVPEDWEDREQTLFRSTEVGDDMDRPLIKSDGSYTYFAADVAYFKDKHDRGFERMVYVLGADHSGYAKRLQAVARAIAGEKADLDVLFCQLVKLLRNGQPVKMSKRAGDFITLRDVVNEVGKDAVRFMMLFRKPEAPLDFDFAKVTEQSKDNPVFYVQYAHARVFSVFRQVGTELPALDVSVEALAKADLSQLVDAGEIGLIRKLAEFPRIVEQAARADEPHRIAFYLHELASDVHSHWSRGKENRALRFINHKNETMTLARLVLLRSIAQVIASGLGIVGVDAPEEMR